ncbi:hypothetical protein EJB05_42147, partial [Eragrostis curvula]
MASFTTTFNFRITPDPSNPLVGDGMAFFLGDPRSYLPEDVAVGFSAATGNAGEQHQILSWPSFSSTLEPKTAILEPSPPPRSSVDPIISKQGSKGGATLIAVVVPLLVLVACAAVGLFLWQRHKKRKLNEANDDRNDHEQDYRAELERGVAASGPMRYTYPRAGRVHRALRRGREPRPQRLRKRLPGQARRPAGEDQGVLVGVVGAGEEGVRGGGEDHKQAEASQPRAAAGVVRQQQRAPARLRAGRPGQPRQAPLLLYSSERLLTCQERYQIILGQEWEQCVVHGDIKSSNIMLDETLGCKLGDFDLARLGEHDGAGWHTTKAVLGTAGYIESSTRSLSTRGTPASAPTSTALTSSSLRLSADGLR